MKAMGNNAASVGPSGKSSKSSPAGIKTTMKTDYGLDKSSMGVPMDTGKKLGGSRDNVAHSLSGTSAKMS